MKLAKGYRGAKSKQFKKANETVMKALYYAQNARAFEAIIDELAPLFEVQNAGVSQLEQMSGNGRKVQLKIFLKHQNAKLALL